MTQQIISQLPTEDLSQSVFKTKTCQSLVMIGIIFIIISLSLIVIGNLPVSVIAFSGGFAIIGSFMAVLGISLFLASLFYASCPKINHSS